MRCGAELVIDSGRLPEPVFITGKSKIGMRILEVPISGNDNYATMKLF
jgi:hypothetical protein